MSGTSKEERMKKPADILFDIIEGIKAFMVRTHMAVYATEEVFDNE